MLNPVRGLLRKKRLKSVIKENVKVSDLQVRDSDLLKINIILPIFVGNNIILPIFVGNNIILPLFVGNIILTLFYNNDNKLSTNNRT